MGCCLAIIILVSGGNVTVKHGILSVSTMCAVKINLKLCLSHESIVKILHKIGLNRAKNKVCRETTIKVKIRENVFAYFL